jgi:hypothetical protein
MSKRLTELEIAARVVPTMLRWPAEANTIAWGKLRGCVEALRGLVSAVNMHCSQAEQDHDLSAEGIVRRRAKVGQQALAELESFKPLQDAINAVESNLAFLEERMADLPKPTSNVIEFMMEQELRGHINKQNSPFEFTLKAVADRRILGAVLNAPPCLSGLRDNEWSVVREKARTTLYPAEAEMQRLLKKAVSEVQEGSAAARRALMQRCGLREDQTQKELSQRAPTHGNPPLISPPFG